MKARIAPPVCYVMKVRIDRNTVFYKIGETHNLTKREKDLQKAYRKATEVKTILTETFPIDDNKRFSDNDVRKYLIANWDAESVSPTIIRGVLDAEADTEFIQFRNYVSDEDVCYLVSEGIKDIAKDCLNFHIKLHRDYSKKVSKLDKEHWTHLVTTDFMPVFNKMLPPTKDLVGKTILMIGQFANQIIDNFASHNKIILCVEKKRCIKYQPHSLNPNNITVFYYKDFEHDKSDDVVDLTDTMTWEEMIRKVYEMNTKIDAVIANPPYAIGNDITSAVIKTLKIDEDAYVNLMPKSKYKNKKSGLFEHIVEIKDAPDLFDDAVIGDVLTMARLSNNKINKFSSYEELEMSNFDKTFEKFYKENLKRPATFKVSPYCSRPDKEIEDYNPTTDFFVYLRTSDHGVDMSGGMYEWNNELTPKERLREYIVRHYEDRGDMIRGHFIYFSALEKKNFTEWFYSSARNGLAHKLIKGLHRGAGLITPAIPRVDWSRPWTDEEILLDYGYTPEEIRKILA